jgi:hypothetical protein
MIWLDDRIEVSEEGQGLQGVYAWGIDGDLRGNEARMQGRLPFLTQVDDARVFAARTTNWDLDSKQNLVVFQTEAEAAQHGTQLFSQSKTAILPGQLVVLFGPRFVTNILAIEEPHLSAWMEARKSAQSGFRIVHLRTEDFENLARSISEVAKKCFDREVQRLGGEKLSEKASAALEVLRNTGHAPVYDQAIRALVAEWIQQKPDLYRKTLKLTALRLRKSPEALEQDAKRHLDILLHKGLGPKTVTTAALPVRRSVRPRTHRTSASSKYRYPNALPSWRKGHKSETGNTLHE